MSSEPTVWATVAESLMSWSTLSWFPCNAASTLWTKVLAWAGLTANKNGPSAFRKAPTPGLEMDWDKGITPPARISAPVDPGYR